MKCQFCNCPDSRVVDSRPTEEGSSIRRRRECINCGRRFTTYEKVEMPQLLVIKKDNNRELFDPQKIRSGIPQGNRLIGSLRRLTHKGDIREDAENQPVHRVQGVLREGQVAAPFQIIKNSCHSSHLLK